MDWTVPFSVLTTALKSFVPSAARIFSSISCILDTLLLDEHMKDIRHSSGSCRRIRIPGNFLDIICIEQSKQNVIQLMYSRHKSSRRQVQPSFLIHGHLPPCTSACTNQIVEYPTENTSTTQHATVETTCPAAYTQLRDNPTLETNIPERYNSWFSHTYSNNETLQTRWVVDEAPAPNPEKRLENRCHRPVRLRAQQDLPLPQSSCQYLSTANPVQLFRLFFLLNRANRVGKASMQNIVR